MLFTLIMSKRTVFSVTILVILLFFTWFLSDVNEQDKEFFERVKVSLREVGNQLLLANKDSTSLVLPVILEKSTYKISFEKQLSIEPKNLVGIIENSFQKAKNPTSYLVEVKHCSNQEVAYSYEMINKRENSIIPCFGRVLPKNCYTIEVKFINQKSSSKNKNILYAFVFGIFALLLFFLNKKKQSKVAEKYNDAFNTIGSFQFYPKQNKLVKEAVEINLSKKECELLEIFVANPNQIIKRDELVKKVWEDHGVVVGRSLDTYISKLRKKLKDDESIKLTNVHGVGYKLEVNH